MRFFMLVGLVFLLLVSTSQAASNESINADTTTLAAPIAKFNAAWQISDAAEGYPLYKQYSAMAMCIKKTNKHIHHFQRGSKLIIPTGATTKTSFYLDRRSIGMMNMLMQSQFFADMYRIDPSAFKQSTADIEAIISSLKIDEFIALGKYFIRTTPKIVQLTRQVPNPCTSYKQWAKRRFSSKHWPAAVKQYNTRLLRFDRQVNTQNQIITSLEGMWLDAQTNSDTKESIINYPLSVFNSPAYRTTTS